MGNVLFETIAECFQDMRDPSNDRIDRIENFIRLSIFVIAFIFIVYMTMTNALQFGLLLGGLSFLLASAVGLLCACLALLVVTLLFIPLRLLTLY